MEMKNDRRANGLGIDTRDKELHILRETQDNLNQDSGSWNEERARFWRCFGAIMSSCNW